MIDEKRFSGVLNLDDSDTLIMPEQHKDARNLRFYGTPQGLIAENIMGTVEVSFTKPAGTNQCIGAHYDQLRRRIYFFNWNSNTRHGIYYYDMRTGTVTKLFLCFTDSATDILNFSRNYPVHSCAIVYRETGDGDLLYWTDSNPSNRPKYINVDTVATLTPFSDTMLNAAKNAPLAPPTFPVVAGTNNVFGYYSDATVNFNAVKNKQFRFAYRWVYKNGEKSTFSPISIVPLAYVVDPNLVVAQTTDNYIKFLVYSPATEDFKAIEVFGQEWLGTTFSDWFIIDKLDRTDFNISVSSSYTYSFYNDGIYVPVSTDESDLYFDWLPDYANTLELLNGNVLIYGGITDGYDQMTRSQVNVTITSSLVSMTPVISTIENSAPTWLWGCNQRFGLVYFDDRGKTNGVVSFITDSAIDTTDFAVTTPAYPGQTNIANIQIPSISATISHTPPTWATSYQWVRADLTPKFVQWVTMDYQTDVSYLYLCIQNLVEMNSKSGFLPSYEFVKGDRVRILAKLTGDNALTVYSTQQDFPVLDVVQKQMSSPPDQGAFIKVPKPSSFPTPAYSATMLIEIYTPIKKSAGTQQLFFEWGKKYDIYTSGGNRYHRGQTQDQTVSLPATFAWTDGDVYIKRRPFFLSVPIQNNTTYSYMAAMDENWNDYVSTSGNANGRAWVIDENAKNSYNPVLARWGGKYQAGTNINNLNRFRPSDFDEVDRAKGDIRRFKARDRIIRVFQDRGVGQYGIYSRFIQNNEGTPELVTTNEIITTNNIQYYQGQYGLGGFPTSLVCASTVDYFSDPVRGEQIRLSGDGITVISDLYKGQFTIKGYLTPYNRALLRSDGSNAKIMGHYDYFDNQYHCILQAGTDGIETTTAKNFSFNEPRNGYASFYDFNPEWAIGAEDITFSFVDGALYIHNNTGAYCTFYGTTYPAYVTVVFNKNLLEKKTFLSVTEVANTTWICPSVYTNSYSYNTQRQDSNLIAQDFTVFEGQPSASFLRDVNSIGGIVVGDTLKGSLLVVKFQVASPTNLVNLSSVTVTAIDSPLTSK